MVLGNQLELGFKAIIACSAYAVQSIYIGVYVQQGAVVSQDRSRNTHK